MAIEYAVTVGLGIVGFLLFLFSETINVDANLKVLDRFVGVGKWYKLVVNNGIFIIILTLMHYIAESAASMNDFFGVLRNVMILFFVVQLIVNVFGVLTGAFIMFKDAIVEGVHFNAD